MLKTAAALFLLSATVFAQAAEAQQFTTQAPINARYEIRQVANRTLRLDRFSGKITRMTRTSDGSAWEEMPVTDLQPTAATEPRFQLSNWSDSLSLGIPARHAYRANLDADLRRR